MLKENMKRLFEAPYYAAAAKKMLNEYQANQRSYMNPDEVMWIDTDKPH